MVGGGGKWSLTFIRALAPPILIFVTSDLNDNFSWTPFYMIQPKTKFRFSVQNHDFWQALEGSDHFMPPPLPTSSIWYSYQSKVKNSPNALRAIVCDNNVLARFVELNGRFFNVKIVIVWTSEIMMNQLNQFFIPHKLFHSRTTLVFTDI